MKKSYFFILIVIILCSMTTNLIFAVPKSPSGLITHKGQPLFLSGMNLAWINYANDMDGYEGGRFNLALKQISKAGGNTIRWWVHVNGAYSPILREDGYVTGLSNATIRNIKRALDAAEKRGVGLILTLWSFDLLQKQGQNLDATLNLVKDRQCIESYVKNALTPMVKALKGHPALIAWEVCNEPEGMTDTYGWSSVRVKMEDVQQFVNLIAGGIHQADPEAKVTNGSWCLKVVGNIEGCVNYYSDQELIKAGGDELGYLDFYQVHYYPQHFDESYSPFHHPASYWNLDKPILIGEFPGKGLYDFGKGYRPKTTLTTEEAYRYALENGYAGILAWTWTNHDGFGGVKEAAPGMNKVRELAPELLNINSQH